MDWIEVNGITLRYDLSGSGKEVLVLVHEMGGTLELWDDVLPQLSEGRRVLRFDMRGAGLSEKPVQPLDLDVMVDDIATLLDALAITAPVAIAGCAIGGAMAMHFAAKYQDRTAALIAMGPAIGVVGDRRTATLARADTVERSGLRSIEEALFTATYPRRLQAADPQRFRRFRARFFANHPSSYAAINRLLANMEMERDLEAIRCPTLVLAGTMDALRPPDQIEPLALKVSNAEFRALETGHFMPLQTPDLVAREMTNFLARAGV